MARMYSGKAGKSKSKRPLVPATWVTYRKDEIERLVVKLANDGLTSAKIGLVLRDQYGIPSVADITKKNVTKILKENNLLPKYPEDLFTLLKKAVNLREHLKRNKRDCSSKHGLELMESKIRRLVKYYIRNNRLEKGWKYVPEQAKLIIEKEK